MWQINLVENTVEISDDCAQDLMKIEDKQSFSWDPFIYEDEAWPTQDGKLFFDSEAYEHMDYMYNDDLLDILLKHKVNGKIVFNSFDGDNSGKAWGYSFKDGVCTFLEGKASTMRLKPVK